VRNAVDHSFNHGVHVCHFCYTIRAGAGYPLFIWHMQIKALNNYGIYSTLASTFGLCFWPLLLASTSASTSATEDCLR
jgi:hypothetical protein